MSTFEWARVPSTLFHIAIHSTTLPDAPSTSSGANITTYLSMSSATWIRLPFSNCIRVGS